MSLIEEWKELLLATGDPEQIVALKAQYPGSTNPGFDHVKERTGLLFFKNGMARFRYGSLRIEIFYFIR